MTQATSRSQGSQEAYWVQKNQIKFSFIYIYIYILIHTFFVFSCLTLLLCCLMCWLSFLTSLIGFFPSRRVRLWCQCREGQRLESSQIRRVMVMSSFVGPSSVCAWDIMYPSVFLWTEVIDSSDTRRLEESGEHLRVVGMISKFSILWWCFEDVGNRRIHVPEDH